MRKREPIGGNEIVSGIPGKSLPWLAISDPLSSLALPLGCSACCAASTKLSSVCVLWRLVSGGTGQGRPLTGNGRCERDKRTRDVRSVGKRRAVVPAQI